MSGIVLSASVRQNLLSLQSTAELLSTTQNRLATGKKVTRRSTTRPTSSPRGPRQPRQRHQQSARRHRQRRAGAAGCQHRHHLAAEAGRYREVDRQPGAADDRGYSPKSTVNRGITLGGTAADLRRRHRPRADRRSDNRRDRRRHGISITFGASASQFAELEYGAGGQRPLGQPRHHRQAHHHDHQRCGFVHDRCDHVCADTGTVPQLGLPVAPVVDAASQAIRSNLVNQYNNILSQITTTAQDSSFNGINLLNGDNLKLTFNETGKSTLNITGVNFNAAGLGLAS